MTNKKITLRESELRGLLESEHARGYKMGLNCGTATALSERARLASDNDELRKRVEVQEVLLAGTGPAAAALARIVKGE